MTALLTDVDAWITAAMLAVIMLVGWAAAWWSGKSSRQERREGPESKFRDAIVALLGLLLAFTFSMSLVKHEQRRQLGVTDSNAVGDFYTCASLLDEPLRGDLQRVVRAYAEHRLELAGSPVDELALQQSLDEIRSMHDRMQGLVRQAIDEGTPIVVPLVNTLNALTSSHAARLAEVRDRLPPSIVLLLAMAAVLSMVMTGWQQGATQEHHPGATGGFVVLVCLVVWVTLDLNQPQQGWITVSQEPLQQLLEGMKQ